MSDSANGTKSERPERGSRRKRWPIVVAIVLVALVALVIAVPRFAAGWLAEQQLARLGIENEGIRSLTVDLLERRIALDTVEFWSADAERGRIEEFSLRYSFANLLYGRAVVDRIDLRGIDIRIDRGEDGRIELNGIALDELFGPAGAEAEAPPADAAAQDAEGFGFGFDSFLLADSRAIFTTAAGSELVVEIERLLVEDIRSWDPDHPAVVDLAAVVNDIELAADAQAHLFSDTIMVDAHVRAASIEVGKIERFIGPLGFERRDGELQANLVTSLQLAADGRVVAGIYGDVAQQDAVLVRPGLEFSAANQRIDFDGVVIAEPDRSSGTDNPPVVLEAAANAGVTSRTVRADAGDAGRLSYALGETRLSDIAFRRDGRGRIRLSAKPSIRVTSPTVSGPLSFETDRLDIAATALEASLDGPAADVRAEGTVRLGGTSVMLPGSGEDGAATSMRTGPIEATLGAMAVAHTPAQTRVTGRLALDAGELVVTTALPAGDGEVSIGSTRADLSDLDLRLAEEGLELGGALALNVDAVGLTAPDARGSAITASLGSIDSQLQDLALTLDPAGKPGLSARLALGLAEIAAELPLGEETASITAPALDFSLEDVAVGQPDERLNVAASGSITLAGLETSLSGASPSRLRLASADTIFEGLEVSVAPDGSRDISAPFELNWSDIAAELPVGGVSAAIDLGSLRLALAELDAVAEPTGTAVRAAGTHGISDLRVRMPASAIGPAMGLDLASLDVELAALDADAREAPPSWQVTSSIDLASLAARIEGEGAASLQLDSIAVDDLQADEALSVEARRIDLAGLDAAFSSSTLAAFAGDGSGRSDARPDPSPDGPAPSVRVGAFSIARPASIRFTDNSFEPPVEVATDVEQLDITDIDTRDPSQRTTLRVAATINEKAELALTGWATLADHEDFDLELDLSNLQLATFSPYAVRAVGLNTESGIAGTTTTAAAADGDLDGRIDVEIEDLILVPASEADAEAASAAIGMPVGVVVGVLEDSEGKIELTFPVSGTVEAPEIGLAEVISEAVVASMAAIFPPTALARMVTSEGNFELQPVPFAAGSAELDEEGRAAADNLVELLQTKPNLEVLLCGRATAADATVAADDEAEADGEAEAEAAAADAPGAAADAPGAASDAAGAAADAAGAAADAPEAVADAPGAAAASARQAPSDATLVELARSRASAVEDYLEEAHGLAAERIRDCRPNFDPADTGTPRVDVSLT